MRSRDSDDGGDDSRAGLVGVDGGAVVARKEVEGQLRTRRGRRTRDAGEKKLKLRTRKKLEWRRRRMRRGECVEEM